MNADYFAAALEERISIQKVTGSSNREVTGLAYDSRDVKSGYAFFALKGIHTDGHDYIFKAIGLGAPVIFHSDELPEYKTDTVYIRVLDTRVAMAPVSAFF